MFLFWILSTSLLPFVPLVVCDTICPPCKFPFTFDNKTYFKCTKENKDVPWCVTNQTLFDNSDTWQNSYGSNLGWVKCNFEDKSCEVEETRECDDSRCEETFIYKSHSYTNCTTLNYYYDHEGWCITNQTNYDHHFDTIRREKGNLKPSKKFGWTTCSEKCSFEHIVCKECYNGCTDIGSELKDYSRNQMVPWCFLDENHDQ